MRWGDYVVREPKAPQKTRQPLRRVFAIMAPCTRPHAGHGGATASARWSAGRRHCSHSSDMAGLFAAGAASTLDARVERGRRGARRRVHLHALRGPWRPSPLQSAGRTDGAPPPLTLNGSAAAGATPIFAYGHVQTGCIRATLEYLQEPRAPGHGTGLALDGPRG